MIQESIERLAEIEMPTNPFPGLRPFEYHESHLFFGREGQGERLIEKLSRKRFLAVVGTSGSGKSSLVRAGLLPELMGGMMAGAGSLWRVALMRPGDDPIGNLARGLNSPDAFGADDKENRGLQIDFTEATLRRGNLGLVEAVRQTLMPALGNLLVIADQFEELFRVGQGAQNETDKEDRANDKAAFVKLLLEAARQRELNIYVVLTMRSDYLGDCSQFQDLPEAINEGQYLIPRMTREQRRQAITGPVAVGEAEITPRLVNRLLNDVGDNPDQLPILQHALMRTWNEWRDKPPEHAARHEGEAIDLCCYESIGGMGEALSLHADEAYNEVGREMGNRGQQIVEQMFKLLTEKGADNREVRRQAGLGAICAVTGATEAEVIAVIETFRAPGRSFLTPPAGTPLSAESLIDISHESLIRGWKGKNDQKRLKEWVDDEAASSREYLRLVDTAMRHGQGRESLLRDNGLRTAIDWREKHNPNRAWALRYHQDFNLAMSFLEQSGKANEAAMLAERQRQKRELTQRRTRIFAVILGIAALISIGLAMFAYRQRTEALAAKRDATQQKDIAVKETNLRIGIAKEAEQKAEFAILQTKEVEKAMLATEEQHQLAVAQTKRAEEEGKFNRHLLYVANMNLARKALEEGNYLTGQEFLNTFLAAPNPPASDDQRSFYWYYLWLRFHNEKDTFNEKATLKGHINGVSSLAFSPDGTTLASAGADHTIRLWRVQDKEEIAVLRGHTGRVRSVAFSSDSRMLASAGDDNNVKMWDVQNKLEIITLNEDTNSVAFSSDGRTLARGGDEGTIRLWDVQGKQEISTTGKHPDSVYSVVFTPDGTTLASISDARTVRLWDVQSMKLIATLSGDGGGLRSIAFSPDGRLLAGASDYRTVILWDVRSRQRNAMLEGHTSYVRSVAFSPDGRTLASASADRTVRLWDVQSKREIALLKGQNDPLAQVVFSPDGRLLAGANIDSTIRLWDVQGRMEVPTLREQTGSVHSVAFSPDDGKLASSGQRGTIRLWDVRKMQETGLLRLGTGSVSSVAFSPDGSVLAGAGADGTVRLWDAQRNRELATFKGHKGIVESVAFSLDNKTLASAGRDSTIRLWDVQHKREIVTLRGHTNHVYSVAFSPDGRTLASASWDNTVRLWNVHDRKEIAMLKGHTEYVFSVAFSPDGRMLAGASVDRTVILWDVQSRQKIAALKGHAGLVRSVAFSPDGRTLASAGNDRAVRLWDVQSRQEIASLAGDTSQVNGVAFSRDGRTLASAGSDGTIRLWLAATDKEVAAQRNR